MNENLLREEIVRVGRSLFERGYVHATAGNISVRLADGGYLITPTDASLGNLDPARLARLDASMQQLEGDRASKTIALHSRIYAAASRVAATAGTGCVIHTHSTHCVALTLDANEGDELLPPITPYFVMKVGHVPRIPYHRPGAPEAAEAVARAIARYGERGTPIRAVMLERLGPNVWHDSPAAAMAVLEELEETARLWWMSRDRAQGAPAPLSEDRIDELRRQFGAHW
ncbi:aldolase [Variovorax sp. OV329]|uniref:class II aldolase/adducin family protein n=1 Tax=Variovorax sp. OV329 TaxID=1882825 RepID=UPI0008ED5305|nr:aldolase [Variovorax sp. OV329]SFM32419.1 Ribulose-5-phosphate 4-epimerase/Fuculose-1-phosphate aldolase [Variovorax sp. OV329]